MVLPLCWNFDRYETSTALLLIENMNYFWKWFVRFGTHGNWLLSSTVTDSLELTCGLNVFLFVQDGFWYSWCCWHHCVWRGQERSSRVSWSSGDSSATGNVNSTLVIVSFGLVLLSSWPESILGWFDTQHVSKFQDLLFFKSLMNLPDVIWTNWKLSTSTTFHWFSNQSTPQKHYSFTLLTSRWWDHRNKIDV